MSDVSCHEENRWGSILEYRERGIIEIRWYDTTAVMEGGNFDRFLEDYASAIEASGAVLCLVDATAFRMDMGKMSMGWRDENIVPRYNAAGVRKFAFHMPSGMPAIGAPPKAEGPADFPTAYFGARESALAWLAEAS